MTAAGKTGTTTDDYDRWFVGYTPYYTAAVWTGYDSQETINASVNPACVLWQKVMTGVSQGAQDIGFQSNLQTTQCTYCTSSGLGTLCLPGRGAQTGTFVLGDEPTTYCDRHIYSNGNLILNYQRTGAAAKARIHGEVSYIPKKVEKKKEKPKQDKTEKSDEQGTEEEPKDDEGTPEEEDPDEEKKDDDKKQDDKKQDDKKQDDGAEKDTPEADETE